MSLESLLQSWNTDPSIGPHITAWKTLPARQPCFVEFPPQTHPDLIHFLADQEISALYRHQRLVWDEVRKGNNAAVVSGTASGKTLSYTLPVLDDQLKNPSSRALFIFPTKALSHDQLSALRSDFRLQAAAYDGDTPRHQRREIRSKARIIVTNPDMLHLGILPHHTNWANFFQHLKFVVLDEMHIYRGVFGSHVANVIRRLSRICRHYGSDPRYILTSATIGNPVELAESLIEQSVRVISEDHSARGEKHFLLYNPPVIDELLGLRVGMQSESVRLTGDLIQHNLQSILFGRSRKSVEQMLTKLREHCRCSPEALRAYRSGYLPARRREIESKLRSQDIKAVVATTALELGIDIGSLDAAVLAGYPGSISSTWQQAGRSGRTDQPSLSVLIASSSPLDQYIIQHPEYFFGSNPEHALLDPNNLIILLNHIRCAAFELPFSQGECFGGLSAVSTREFLEILQRMGTLHFSRETYFWMADQYPSAEISLRSASSQRIALRVPELSADEQLIGTVDRESALWMVHPGAIYLHEGESYRVDDLRLDENTALLTSLDPDYYTEPEKQTEVSLLEKLDETHLAGAELGYGELLVKTRVIGYKRISKGEYFIQDRQPLDLPATTLETTGFWLIINEDTEKKLRRADLWTSSPLEYGNNWPEIRQQVLQRDQHQCQVCGKRISDHELHIHHKTPLRSFSSLQSAHQLNNLITLCPRCHQRVESVVRVRSGLGGVAHVLHSLAPLLVMCDSQDLGVHADPQSPLGKGRPTVVVFEHIPAGLGLSKRIFDRHGELLASARDLISTCSCQTGCPSCVGPGGELGSGSKKETLAILQEIT